MGTYSRASYYTMVRCEAVSAKLISCSVSLSKVSCPSYCNEKLWPVESSMSRAVGVVTVDWSRLERRVIW